MSQGLKMDFYSKHDKHITHNIAAKLGAEETAVMYRIFCN